MPTGITTAEAVEAAKPYVIASARNTRDFVGIMPSVVERQRLTPNTGDNWVEFTWDKILAHNVDVEQTPFERTEQLTGSVIKLEPTKIGVSIMLGERAARRWSTVVIGKIGTIAMAAMQVKKDKDGLALFSLATNDVGAAGQTFSPQKVAAAGARVTGNRKEPGPTNVVCVGNPFSTFAIDTALTRGLYATGQEQLIPMGISAESFMRGYRGDIRGVSIFEDGHINIDGNDDAINGVFSRNAIIMVEGKAPEMFTKPMPEHAGAVQIWMYDEYIYGQRSKGNWLFAYTTDASEPS